MERIYATRVGRVTASAVLLIALLGGATTAFSAERTIEISRAKGPDPDLRKSIAAQVAASTDPLSPTALKSFRDLLETRGWPTFDAAGREGIDDAGKLLLRASSDVEFQQQLLRLLDDRVGVDIDPLGYARLSDHVQIRHDQTQSYGTLMGLVDGGMRSARFWTASPQHDSSVIFMACHLSRSRSLQQGPRMRPGSAFPTSMVIHDSRRTSSRIPSLQFVNDWER